MPAITLPTPGSTPGPTWAYELNTAIASVDDAADDAIDLIDTHIGSGGSAHANATTSVAGFMSASDKTTLGNRAPLASPTFTGTPAAPTAAAHTSTTQIATTAYVQGELTSVVPTSRTINGYALTSNIALTAADVSAAPLSHVGSTGTANHGVATTSVSGFMSASDKTKVDGMGTLVTASTASVSLASGGSDVQIDLTTNSGGTLSGGALTLPSSGVWLVVIVVQFAAGVTGFRRAGIGVSGTEDPFSQVLVAANTAANSTRFQTSLTVSVTGPISVMVSHNAGTALNVVASLQATRVA